MSQSVDALDAQPPAELSRAFPDGGYYVMRDGWTRDASYLLIDCGPHGADNCGHAHADALAFDLAAHGRTLLVDPGTFTYTGAADVRDAFRASAAHNTLTIDGESSSVPDRAFTWQHIARATTHHWTTHRRFDFFEGAHDGYARLPSPATHARSVLFIKGDYWILRDRVTTSGAHRYELGFHFAAGSVSEPITKEGDAAVAREPRTANAAGLDIFSFGRWRRARRRGLGFASATESARPRPSLSSRRRRRARKSSSRCCLRARHAARAGDHDGTRNRSGRRARVRGVGDDARNAGGCGADVALVGDGGRTVETARFASDFEWAWLRSAGGASGVDELILIGGSRLKIDGREVLRSATRAGYVVARRAGDEWLVESDAGDALVCALPTPHAGRREAARSAGHRRIADGAPAFFDGH